MFVERTGRDIVLARTRGISNHLANDTPAPNSAVEWPLTAGLDNFVSAVETSALIAAGRRAGYFWGPSAVLDLGDGLVEFENNDLPGIFPPSLDRPSDDPS